MAKSPTPIGEFTTPYKWTKRESFWIPELSEEHRIRFDKLKNDLKIEDTAHRDGAHNEPHADDANLNDPQLKVQERIFKGMSLLNEFLAEQLTNASQNIIGKEHEIDGARHARDVEAEVNDRLQANGTLIDAKEDAVAAERAFRFFRAQNGLRRQPEYRESPILFWAVMCGLLVIESFANGYVFKDVNTGGLIGGILMAMGVSAVNLLLGFVGGLVGWRLLGHKSNLAKALGLFVTVATLCLALAWNMYVAHYRQAAEDAISRMQPASAEQSANPAIDESISNVDIAAPTGDIQGELLRSAADGFVNNTFGLTHPLAWILLAVGMFVFLMACREAWEDLADRYWGYRKVHVKSREKREAFDEQCEEVKDEITDYLEDEQKKLRTKVQQIVQLAAQSYAVADLAEQRLLEVRNSEASWVYEGNRLLNLYRTCNEQVRDPQAGVPAYWSYYPDAEAYRTGRFSGGPEPAHSLGEEYELGNKLIEQIRDKRQKLDELLADNRTQYATFEDALHTIKISLPAKIETLRNKVSEEADRRLGPDTDAPAEEAREAEQDHGAA